ncbi:DUF5989 family protein [Mucilaginibacter sp. SMC90]|nr:DUF5989 family protein [Mucilaginibacter sp. SMC90]UOE46542.1 DUF5989 family protein [Mucilaginibacter sp. SMC90]
METITEFLSFMVHRRKYWLWPLFFILFCLALLVVVAHGTALAPFIYSLF